MSREGRVIRVVSEQYLTCDRSSTNLEEGDEIKVCHGGTIKIYRRSAGFDLMLRWSLPPTGKLSQGIDIPIGDTFGLFWEQVEYLLRQGLTIVAMPSDQRTRFSFLVAKQK